MTPEAAAAKIRAARKKIRPLVTAFHRAAAIIVRDERAKAFDTGTAPDGSKWQALKPETIKRKSGQHATLRVGRKQGISGLKQSRAKMSATPTKPLLDTGIMSKPTIQANAKQGKVIMARARGEVVSGAGSIAAIHNNGTAKIPKREHWAIYPEADKRITKAWDALKDEIVKDIGL